MYKSELGVLTRWEYFEFEFIQPFNVTKDFRSDMISFCGMDAVGGDLKLCFGSFQSPTVKVLHL